MAGDALLADVARALRAQRPDHAEALLRELEIWEATSGAWHANRFVPGGPLAAPISPHRCVEAAVTSLRASFPDRGVALASALVRRLWPTAYRVPDFYDEIPPDAWVPSPDEHPSVAILAPPDAARTQSRLALLERRSGPADDRHRIRIYTPAHFPCAFHLSADGSVSVEHLSEGQPFTVDGVPAELGRHHLQDTEILEWRDVALLFLDRKPR